MKNITLNVEGMSCGHCVHSIEGALKTLGANGKVDLAGGTVAIAYDESILTVDTIKEVIEDQGYSVV